jgi:UDP-N-acetylmuramoylalanine--D-glutamate ligase
MNNNPIGVIDSGVGGLTIWRKIIAALPMESTIYLADSKNVPYGNKTQEQIYEFAKQMLRFLIERNVKAVVLACNTITVSCLAKLREDFPQIPIIGTVPVVKTAVEKTKNKKIGILSTEYTAQSDYQRKLIGSFADGCEVINLGTNQLVPLIEKGEVQGERINKALNEELKKFKEKNVDVIALGCSHFPFLTEEIQKIMGDEVLILESGEAIARQTKRVLEKINSLALENNPYHLFYATGNSDEFSKVSSELLNKNIKARQAILENNFAGKKVGIIGLGIEGFSTAKFLLEKGAKVTILDKKEEQNFDSKIISEIKQLSLKFILGEDYLDNLNDFEMIVKSPGVKRDLEKLSTFEKSRGIITSQIKLFFDLCPCPIIGVTGTKGKGTTSTLIYQMLKTQGFDAYLGGNIGNSPLDFLSKLASKSWVILELSSFQLMDLTRSPHIAVMLMTTSEHLDYHKNTEEYIQAKRNILRFQSAQDFAVINRDYPASNESDILTQGKIFKVSKERVTENGCFVKDKSIWTNINGSEEEIIKVEEVLLPGEHNLENICAAVIVAKILKVQKKHIVEVLRNFKGLEHRLELVGEINGAKYYDDSFSTTPETAIAAIKSFKNPEILILGGSGKESDFSELGKVIGDAKNIKAIIGIGKEWERIKAEIKIVNSEMLIIEGAGDMKTIIAATYKIAKPQDVVLLTPACASFDMFKNYKDRGNQFKEEVGKL